MKHQPGNIPTPAHPLPDSGKHDPGFTQADADALNAKNEAFMFEQAWNKRDGSGRYLRDLDAEIAEIRASAKYASDPVGAEAVIATMQKALATRGG